MLFCMITAMLVSGCGDTVPSHGPDDYVIRAGSVTIFADEFESELELKQSAYPYDIQDKPVQYNAMVLDLVSTLSDEAAMLSEAQLTGVGVSDAQVDAKVAEFKRQYPADSFDQMLMENAIEFSVWKNRLKKDMILEKLVQKELVDTQTITPDDVMAFYAQINEHNKKHDNMKVDESGLIRQLRLEKSQKAYDGWISQLKQTYPPQINQKNLARFLLKHN